MPNCSARNVLRSKNRSTLPAHLRKWRTKGKAKVIKEKGKGQRTAFQSICALYPLQAESVQEQSMAVLSTEGLLSFARKQVPEKRRKPKSRSRKRSRSPPHRRSKRRRSAPQSPDSPPKKKNHVKKSGKK